MTILRNVARIWRQHMCLSMSKGKNKALDIWNGIPCSSRKETKEQER